MIPEVNLWPVDEVWNFHCGTNEFDSLKLFKKSRTDLSIILLTANVREEERIEAKKLGAMEVIEKPADLNLLTQIIEEAKALKIKRPKE